MTILIGFEFEFGWLRKDRQDYDFQVFLGIKKELKKSFGNDFVKNIKEIVCDGSLEFSHKFGDVCGAEVVTKPMEEEKAIIFCKTFLNWMKNESRVLTNKTCSLHVNVNFKDKKLNEKIDYFSVTQKTPQKEILEKFGRLKNTYCIPTTDKKFGLKIKNKETPRHGLDYWLTKVNQSYITTTLRKPHPHLYKKNPNKGAKETVFFEDKDELLNVIKEAYIDRISNEQKGVAIVEKPLGFKNKYYEFRMIGNTDYESNYNEIKKCITVFKNVLKKSIVKDC